MTRRQKLLTIADVTRDCCCMCGLAVTELLTNAHVHELLTNAHVHDSQRTVRLCWTCHRAYDIDILTTHEVLAAERETLAGARRVDVSAMHGQWRLDLDAGARRINKQRQHGQTPEQARENARKAIQTMRARRASGPPQPMLDEWEQTLDEQSRVLGAALHRHFDTRR